MEFAIVIAIPRERDSRLASPGACCPAAPDARPASICDWRMRASAKIRSPFVIGRLLEGGRNGAKGVLQVGAEALDDGDDRNRDAGGDETIFDGGRSRFVLEKRKCEILHGKLLLVPHGGPATPYIVID